MIETIVVFCIFVFFLSGSQNEKGYPRGVNFFENFIVVVSTVSCSLKIYFLRNDRMPAITIVLAILAVAIFPIVLAENNIASVLEASLYNDFFSDSAVLASVILCILVPSIINWIIVTLLQINYVSYLVHHLSFVNKLIDKHPEKGNSKKVDTGDKIHFLNESLKETQTKRYIGSFHITNLVNMVRKISNNQAISVSIGKIISIDLFNYQTGLIKFINYIKERVDRSRFRDYLMYVMKKNTRIQLTLYIVLYGVALVVGLSTPIFRDNYMLDTTVPYMIMMIGFMIWINESVVYYSKLFKYFIAMGVVSLLLFVVLSSTTLNRFEHNFIDMYSGRIWFSVCLEMIDASLLTVTHLIVKILR
jgi:CRISPR/Cas system-associated exonuclease Cas4 (RecB family)